MSNVRMTVESLSYRILGRFSITKIRLIGASIDDVRRIGESNKSLYTYLIA